MVSSLYEGSQKSSLADQDNLMKRDQVKFIFHAFLPLVFQWLDPINQKSYQQHMWRHHVNYAAHHRRLLGLRSHSHTHTHTHTHIHRPSVLVFKVFANGPGDRSSIPGWSIPKTQKMILDASLFNCQNYKVRIKGKMEQTKKRSGILAYTSL